MTKKLYYEHIPAWVPVTLSPEHPYELMLLSMGYDPGEWRIALRDEVAAIQDEDSRLGELLRRCAALMMLRDRSDN